MKIKIKKIFENTIWWSGVITVGIVLGISLQFVRAWTEPTDAPPGGNLGAPINTSTLPQWKGLGGIGSLGITGVLQSFMVHTENFRMPTGAKKGYVLTADDLGNATWQAPSGGGASGSKVFTSDDTWTAPSGVTQVTVTAIGGGGVASYWGDGTPMPWPPGDCAGYHPWGGGGGSGGYTKTFSVPVVPGNNYTIDIGHGGGITTNQERASSGAPTRFLFGASELARADGGQGGANVRFNYVGGSAGSGCSPTGNGGDGTASAGGAGGICPAAESHGGPYGRGGSGGCGTGDTADNGKAGALIIEW